MFRLHGDEALFQDEALFTDRHKGNIFEDRWLDLTVRHMGGKVAPPLTECLSLVLNGYNIDGDIQHRRRHRKHSPQFVCVGQIL